MLFIQAMDLSIAIIEEQDIFVALALGAHDGGSYLAHAHTVAPAFAAENESGIAIAMLEGYIEGRAEEMGLAEGATDLEFLTDGEGAPSL